MSKSAPKGKRTEFERSSGVIIEYIREKGKSCTNTPAEAAKIARLTKEEQQRIGGGPRICNSTPCNRDVPEKPACQPVEPSDECTEHTCTDTGKEMTVDGKVISCTCKYDTVLLCTAISGGNPNASCNDNLDKIADLQGQIKDLEAEIDGLKKDLDDVNDDYESAGDYDEDEGTEGRVCFSCRRERGGSGVSIAQTSIMAGVQALGMVMDYRNRGRMMDVYGDLGWPPPPNAFNPFPAGGYGYGFGVGGVYGAALGGFGSGGFGCSGGINGGGYINGPYGAYSPWGGVNPYGTPCANPMYCNPYGQQMPPYMYTPGTFPGGYQAGPWGVNAGIYANMGMSPFGMYGGAQMYGGAGQMPPWMMGGGYGGAGQMPPWMMGGGYGGGGMPPWMGGGYGGAGQMPPWMMGGGYGGGGMPPWMGGGAGANGGYDYSQYMRTIYSRYMDNYTSTLREYQNLTFDMNSMYQRLQTLQYQLSNPGMQFSPMSSSSGAPVPTGQTPGR